MPTALPVATFRCLDCKDADCDHAAALSAMHVRVPTLLRDAPALLDSDSTSDMGVRLVGHDESSGVTSFAVMPLHARDTPTPEGVRIVVVKAADGRRNSVRVLQCTSRQHMCKRTLPSLVEAARQSTVLATRSAARRAQVEAAAAIAAASDGDGDGDGDRALAAAVKHLKEADNGAAGVQIARRALARGTCEHVQRVLE
jgi:hypothetical protein